MIFLYEIFAGSPLLSSCGCHHYFHFIVPVLLPGAAEAQRLLAELDALKSSSSVLPSFSSQAGCQAELAAANAQTSRARAQAQAAVEAQASAERAAAAATLDAVTSSAASEAYHSSGVVPAKAFDIDSYRAERLAATQPNIIECAEASEGESQDACHLPKNERFASIGQKGVTVWMTGLSGSGKSTIAKALERHLVVELGLSVQNLDGDNGACFSSPVFLSGEYFSQKQRNTSRQ